nr:Fe-S cluster assembly protein SufB [Clostridiales bacterium]MCR5046436.1 Fe-S cluster assembly protein SufB [Treponema sp.]
MADEKTQINDIDRSIYDFRYEESEKDFYRMESGLSEDIIKKISEEKGDPQWMREFRLNSLKLYNQMKEPDWGPDISGLDMANISSYVRPKTKMSGSW